MEGEIAYFRKELFGGFNRDDVVAYIAALAKERNDAIADLQTAKAAEQAATTALQAAENELEKLREKISGYERLIEKLRESSAESKQKTVASETPKEPEPKINNSDVQPEKKSVIIVKRPKLKKGSRNNDIQIHGEKNPHN